MDSSDAGSFGHDSGDSDVEDNRDDVDFNISSAADILSSRFSSTNNVPRSIMKKEETQELMNTTLKKNQLPKPNESMTSLSILSCAGKLDNVISLIEHVDRSNSTKCTRMKKQTLQQRADLSLALKTLKKLSSQLNNAAKNQSNTYSREVHKRKAIDDNENNIMQQGVSKRLKTVSDHVKTLNSNRNKCREYLKAKSPDNIFSSQNIRKSCRSKKKILIDGRVIHKKEKEIHIPNPSIGFCYFPEEMCNILCNKIDSKDMFFVLREMIKLGLVPCKERMALRHIQRYKRGKKLPKLFFKRGRMRIINPKELKEITDMIITGGGEGFGIDETRKIVQDFADKQAIEKGKLPSYDGGIPVSDKTVRVYHEAISTHPEIIVRRKVAAKNEARVAAEDSLRSVTSFLLTIAATHFIEGSPPSGHPCISKKGTAGSRAFYQLIKKSHPKKNVSLYPVHRSLLASSDDTTVYVSPNHIKKKRNDEKVLLSSRHDSRTQEYFKRQSKNDEANSRGMRVKMTFTFLGNGHVFPTYITAGGFSERDIPKSSCPSGIKVIKIPGLCLERNRDPRANKIGYLVLLRKDVALESVHMRNYEHYHKEVYRPSMSKAREFFHNYMHSEDDEVDDELFSVGWLDGDIQQLKAIVKDEIRSQCLKLKNLRCKQSAKRTGVEQMADVCIVFKEFKKLERLLKLRYILNDSLTPELDKIFKKLHEDDELNLPANKVRILKDFLARLPYMLEKTCTVDNIVKGFVDVGFLDARDKVWPDMDKILQTKRKNITSAEKELIIKNFPRLFKLTLDEGHVSDDVYDELGFPNDEAYNKVMFRNHDIASEWRQRAKNLTHDYQHMLWQQREQALQEEFLKSITKKREAIVKIIEKNKAAEEQLIRSIHEHNRKSGDNPEEYPMLPVDVSSATLVMFDHVNAPELKAFIHCRLSATLKINKKELKKFPKKGKFEEAMRIIRDDSAEDNLISLAFRNRSKPVILI